MQPTDVFERLVQSSAVRLAVAAGAAVVWFFALWTPELGRNGGLAFVYGVPAVLVLLCWWTRPWLAMGLSALVLLLVLSGAVNGTAVNEGGVLACATAWFAVLGAASSGDPRLHWAGGLLVAVDTVLSGANNGFPSLIIVLLLGGGALLLGWVLRQRRSADRLRTGLAESEERERAVERDVVIEQERNRVARDVHDVVAHSLAVVIAQADGARYAAEKDPTTVGPALEAIADTARDALGEVRTLLHELRHTQRATPAPGTSDLDALIEGFRQLGLAVEVAHYGHQRALGDATELAVYRVVQESLTNALRHGDTGEPVTVDFDWGDHAVAVVVTNALVEDGVPQVEGPGHGIPGMRERAALAGGDFTVGIGTRGMFRVRASLPASPAPDAPTALMARA
ncbi:sensor histidine kinase [Amnibacterium setariae]|uniref:histidine kinase n=1 Tax=Amnibacterium setariae TaxID=2306585 RepID=A0A3A1U148_9MICO|nr:histidine kinase [Amnibacterium setariae]RIX28176.1 sensor histidine kinase [Amnibacterium setariae]